MDPLRRADRSLAGRCCVGPAARGSYTWRGVSACFRGALVEFRVLGPFEVLHAGEAVRLGSAQQRELLTLLVLRAPEPVSVESLVDELWGERPPATARHAVRVYVSAIRRMLRAAAGEEVV